METCRFARRCLVAALFGVAAGWAGEAKPVDALFEDMPVGWQVTESWVVPKGEADGIGARLGGGLTRLSNTFILVNGQAVRVNILDATDPAAATAIYKSILKMKADPVFCHRTGERVIELSGRGVTVPLAHRVVYELGIRRKPAVVQYRVVSDIALVDRADYMAFNELTQLLIQDSKRRDGNLERTRRIKELASGFIFGNKLTLRMPTDLSSKPSYRFVPPPVQTRPDPKTESVSYWFASTPRRHGIPHVRLTAGLRCTADPLTPSQQRFSKSLVAGTKFWPAEDPEVAALAEKITADADGTGAKIKAILQWLTPHRNLKPDGPAGSRWGVKKVLAQGYGRCWDSSDCFVTLCRALGIAARQVGGWHYGGDGHVWAEVLVPDRGWLQVDPTGGGQIRCGVFHLPYFTTTDGHMPILYVTYPTFDILQTSPLQKEKRP